MTLKINQQGKINNWEETRKYETTEKVREETKAGRLCNMGKPKRAIKNSDNKRQVPTRNTFKAHKL